MNQLYFALSVTTGTVTTGTEGIVNSFGRSGHPCRGVSLRPSGAVSPLSAKVVTPLGGTTWGFGTHAARPAKVVTPPGGTTSTLRGLLPSFGQSGYPCRGHHLGFRDPRGPSGQSGYPSRGHRFLLSTPICISWRREVGSRAWEHPRAIPGAASEATVAEGSPARQTAPSAHGLYLTRSGGSWMGAL